MIVTHLHYDHVGNFEIFPRATFHLQDREMAYATGRYMCHQRLRMPFDVENVTGMVRELYRGRVAFHDGDEELASGLSLHLVGGHSHGLQFVRVHTARGWVVVASDAAHFYANWRAATRSRSCSTSARCWRAIASAGGWPRARSTSCRATTRW